jgi:hypothetical protein
LRFLIVVKKENLPDNSIFKEKNYETIGECRIDIFVSCFYRAFDKAGSAMEGNSQQLRCSVVDERCGVYCHGGTGVLAEAGK